ncbi:MAG: DegQ family serine endoprotease [Deltaproteobacteria bacterium]|nr:DegQ family serine endoprotease [Deltaproteobacteria bacterium]
MKRTFSLRAVLLVALVSVVATAAFQAHTDDIYQSGASVAQPANWFPGNQVSFADLAERASPAVVNVSTTKVVRRGGPGGMPPMGQRDPFFDDFFERFFEGAPREQQQKSLGSGFIMNKDGTILTNSHVVAGADEIKVILADGRSFDAKVVGLDEKTDIAVIRVAAKADLPTVPLGDSDQIRPGDWVMAIGNPFGLEHTVTVGVASATGRVIGGGPYAKFIQTDASINPGNSGGPLFNMKGEVIGINTMIYAGGQGIGFAIPINLAKQLAPQLVEKGKVTRGWLGVSIQDITPELAKSFGLESEEGALLAEVFSGSPAAKAGLQRGDIIVMFDGQKIKDPYDLSLAVGNTSVGKKVDIEALRKGERKKFTADVGTQEEAGPVAARGEEKPSGKADKLGLVARAITVEDTRELDVPPTFRGVVIQRVEPGSAAEAADLRSGDVVLEINGVKIEALTDYNQATAKLDKGSIVRFFVKRGRASVYVAFRL